jgi:HlyD family secretion protein
VAKQKKRNQKQLKNLNVEGKKIKVEAKNYVITHRYLGLLRIFKFRSVLLNASQPIATISATDKLIVESSVSPNDIGLIQKPK